MQAEQTDAEIIIHRSSSRDAGLGWSIRLLRCPGESDDDYTARSIAKHHELANELTMHTCGHGVDTCIEIAREAAKTEAGL